MFSFYGGGYGGYGDDGFDRSTFREKSGAAQRREDAAIAAFDKHAKATEADKAVKAKVTVELLKPSTHLTQPCWTAFNKRVKARAGWTAKRRVATNEEKRASGETRQGKCYFVDVTFDPKKAEKARKAAAAEAAPPAKKQKLITDCPNTPAAAAAAATASSAPLAPAEVVDFAA